MDQVWTSRSELIIHGPEGGKSAAAACRGETLYEETQTVRHCICVERLYPRMRQHGREQNEGKRKFGWNAYLILAILSVALIIAPNHMHYSGSLNQRPALELLTHGEAYST